MIKVDGKGNLKAIKGEKTGDFVIVLNSYFLLDTNKLLSCGLLFDSS